MKKIDFPNGKFAIYDDEFEELVIMYNWSTNTKSERPYTYINRKLVHLTDLLTKKESNQYYIIHKNNNIFDCQLSNLKKIDRSTLVASYNLSKANKTGFKGVKQSYQDKFRADIRVNGKPVYLGTFEFAKDAAEAYNKKAKELYGDLAYQNKI